ncbi:GGDEF domain-containing protein [Streptomyces sp. MUSC 14]|uniref:GGDEF domain-containing protein n=1 Tax=Streptomyces sp. MUSC 14 TaxID=1354889 RepID=UPI0008F5C49A|nr:GGDEF domain-containing protein [Streptomyces sp. MUSC 14]OIK02324.1 GGDEF domain-containing protein [Streptomyces sp. MUSC 14]
MNDLLTMASAAAPLAGGWGVHGLWMRRRLSAARRDPLSGLWTRAPFERRAARLLARHHAAVVLVDLDGFKPLNDTFGHAAGDEAIRVTAASLNIALAEQSGAIVARLGGDEFAAVVPLEEPFTLPWLLNDLHGALTTPFTYRGRTLRVGASVGACLTAELPSRSLPLALRRADEAMYTAKRDGGGWCLAHGPDLTHTSRAGRRSGRPGTGGREAA